MEHVLELSDKVIVLEDDLVTHPGFLSFLNAGLERYADVPEVFSVCGYSNHVRMPSGYGYDAYFCPRSSSWGWATWRRVTDSWEGDYAFLEPGYDRDKLIDSLKSLGIYTKHRLETWEANKASGVEHYETILGVGQYVNSRLNIVPTKNMIINVGNTPEGSTHSMSSLNVIPKGLRRIYTMNTYDIEFPLKHPKYVINDVEFQKKLFRVMGTGHPMVKFWRRIEKTFLIIRHEGLGALVRKLKSR